MTRNGESLLGTPNEHRLLIADDVYYGKFVAMQDRVKVLFSNLDWTWPVEKNNMKIPHYVRTEEWRGFDLREDPKEEHPGPSMFTDAYLPLAYHLKQYIKAQKPDRARRESMNVVDELKEQLKALGYL